MESSNEMWLIYCQVFFVLPSHLVQSTFFSRCEKQYMKKEKSPPFDQLYTINKKQRKRHLMDAMDKQFEGFCQLLFL